MILKPVQGSCGSLGRRQRLRRSLALALLLSASLSHAAPEPRILVFAGTENIDHSQGVWLELIYREALRRIGYQLEYHVYPAKRASALADSGAVDGEIHRVKTYGIAHPDLVLVPTPHFMSSFAAYGLAPAQLSDGWKSPGLARMRVGYRAGVVYCEQMLSEFVPERLRSAAYGIPLGLRKLLRHRTDIYVDDERSVDLVLQDAEFKDSGIRKLTVMGVVGAHAYLNKRHHSLAPAIAAALDEMRREGLIEKYRKRAYGGSDARS